MAWGGGNGLQPQMEFGQRSQPYYYDMGHRPSRLILRQPGGGNCWQVFTKSRDQTQLRNLTEDIMTE